MMKSLFRTHQTGVLFKYLSSSAALLKTPSHDRLRIHLPSQEETQAVCLLAGWSNSSNKVMSKYASIYTDIGVPCVALAPRMANIWFTSSGNKLCGAALSAMEEKFAKSSSPLSLIIHLFSGGGYVVFPKILESWSHSDSIFRTSLIPKCVIFDSGPSEYSIKSGTAASKLMLEQGSFNLLTYYIANMIGISTTVAIGNHKKSVLRSSLESDFLDIPQLYLHSMRDTVAPHDWVSGIVRGQQDKGRRASSRTWADSQHLKLFLDHKEEYTDEVHTFLRKCGVV